MCAARGGSLVVEVMLFLAVVLEDDAATGVTGRRPVIDVSVSSCILVQKKRARVIS